MSFEWRLCSSSFKFRTIWSLTIWLKPMVSIQVSNKMETQKSFHSSLFSPKIWNYTLTPHSGWFLIDKGFFSLLVSLAQDQRFSWQLSNLRWGLSSVWVPTEARGTKEPGCVWEAAAFQSSSHETYWIGSLIFKFAYNLVTLNTWYSFSPQYKHFLFPRRNIRFLNPQEKSWSPTWMGSTPPFIKRMSCQDMSQRQILAHRIFVAFPSHFK